MKKTITFIFLALMAVSLTNAQDIVRTIKTNDWEKKLEKDVTYIIEPFGAQVAIKEGDDYLHFLTLPETLIFDSKEHGGVLINGVRWATRNLAAHGQFVEKHEDYGALFQWGRKGDGHEQRNSSLHSGTVSSGFDANGQILNGKPAYGRFITTDDFPYDWRSPQINTLWNSGTESAPLKTSNDPCPAGWRLPTETELSKLSNSTNNWVTNYQGSGISGCLFGTAPNQIFLPAAGARIRKDGGVGNTGTYGYYWSSTVDDFNAHYLFLREGHDAVGDEDRAFGFSVRCVAE